MRWEDDPALGTGRLRRSTGKLRPQRTLVDLSGVAPHYVYRCEIPELQPGGEAYYEVWRGVGGIPHGAEELAKEKRAAVGAVNADGEPEGERVFSATARVRKRADQRYHFAVAGDIGAGSPEQRIIAASLSTLSLDFVVVPGDFMYSHGRVAEYWASDFFGIYGADLADPSIGGPLLRSTPIFGGLGQHDSEGSHGMLGNVTTPTTSWSPSRSVPGLALGPQTLAEFPFSARLAKRPRERMPFHDGHAWYMYWDFPLNGPDLKPEQPQGPEVWPLGGTEQEAEATLAATGDRWPRMGNYSLTYGNSFWVCLNTWSPVDANSSVLREWLTATLCSPEAQLATWRFVICYMPPFNSGSAYPRTQKMRVLVDVFEAGKVDIVFSSYIHVYQRSAPLLFQPTHLPQGPVRDYGHELSGTITADDDFDGVTNTKANGVIYIVSGAGGQGLHDGVPSQTDNPDTWEPFTVAFNGETHGYSEVTVDGSRLDFVQRDLHSAELDRMVLTK